jgi:molybdopterin synthase catalytic subunit
VHWPSATRRSPPRRGDAFAACERVVEIIEQTVPIWKLQHLADGVTEWVGL